MRRHSEGAGEEAGVNPGSNTPAPRRHVMVHRRAPQASRAGNCGGMMAVGLNTIGYEGCAIGQVLDRLAAAGVAVVIDVRALPLSRKPGFSKRTLAAGLDARGLGYVHLRGLGTPKAGRVAARAGRTGEMLEIFAAHLRSVEAQAALDAAINLSRRRRCCLLCFEADHRRCHRDAVARLICAATGATVAHLSA